MNILAQTLQGTSATPSPEVKTAKLAEAAQQFEAMMLNELLKPMHFGAGVDEGAEEGSGGAADTIRGMGTDALGKALSAHGGMGVARQIVKQVTAAHHAAEVKREGTKVK